jgi:hypothetical protein
MIRLWLIFITLSFSLLFMFFNPEGEWGFLFSEMKLTPELWMYYFFEHLIVLILAIVILIGSKEYRTTLWLFVVIEIIDTVDYCLTYGEPWMNTKITWNTVKVFVFGSSLLFETWKSFQRHYHSS